MDDGNYEYGEIELHTNRNQTSLTLIPDVVHNPYYDGTDNITATKGSSTNNLRGDNIEINTITVTRNLYYE